MIRKKLLTLTIMVLLSSFVASTVFSFPTKRRKDQFETTSGYLAMPLPYSFPGIGTGLFLIGYAGNLLETPTDVFGIVFGGDGEGAFLNLDELFVIPEWTFLTFVTGRIARYGQNVYSSRGMENEKDDFNINVGEDSKFFDYAATLTHFERRLELTVGTSVFSGKVVEIRDSEGILIQKLEDPVEFDSANTRVELKIDLTDDFGDPREGINIRLLQDNQPTINDGPEYGILTGAITYYVPILESSTVVFHYFRSEAHVSKVGNIDLESLKTQEGFYDCGGNPDCENATLNSASNRLNANKYGTAKALGGADRLRAYPQQRYVGAHAQMFGTELRWNFNTSGSKLDWWVLQDVQQAIQGVIFWEEGSVVDDIDELGKIVRSSYGGGVRLVTQSGAVYKFEGATGDEGAQVIMFFEYPWAGLFGQ
ncbi:MAG: hypothetical protein HQM12_20045 [SAR324 cluster bacterium]|nr:hypothetical protein [SAR324 cluster bacterium]